MNKKYNFYIYRLLLNHVEIQGVKVATQTNILLQSNNISHHCNILIWRDSTFLIRISNWVKIGIGTQTGHTFSSQTNKK